VRIVVIVVVLKSGGRPGTITSCGTQSGDLVCGEKTTAGTARTTHCVLVARLVKIWLSLPGEAVDFFETGTGYATFEDAKVLFCVYVERFLVELEVICCVIGWYAVYWMNKNVVWRVRRVRRWWVVLSVDGIVQVGILVG
jgi:hypothetical protein